ncbi:MAG: Peptide deformylase [Planctomycetes bacterium ADurb.Bin412]|nr:MAG: Peptide deformylase [Planctomycetes bacterium ADurb.Bin412]
MLIENMKLDKLYIRHYPDPILRQKAENLTEIGDTIAALAERMTEIMVKAGGIGLAATQVGVPLRMFIFSLTAKPEDVQVIINPELKNFQGVSEIEEGCLSLPDVRAKVRRPAACTLTARDLDGNEFTMDAVDMAATVIQHETDHLDGKLFIDRLSTISRFACRRGIRQLEEEFEDR